MRGALTDAGKRDVTLLSAANIRADGFSPSGTPATHSSEFSRLTNSVGYVCQKYSQNGIIAEPSGVPLLSGASASTCY